MKARVISFQLVPATIDEAIELYRASVVPAATTFAGCKALFLLTDRATGHALSLGLWDEADLIASEDSGFLREQLAKFDGLILGPAVPEVYSVNLWERASIDPACVRVTTALLRQGTFAAAESFFRQSILPDLHMQHGNMATLLLTQPDSRKALLATAWASHEDLIASESEQGFYHWSMARFSDYLSSPAMRHSYDMSVRVVKDTALVLSI